MNFKFKRNFYNYGIDSDKCEKCVQLCR